MRHFLYCVLGAGVGCFVGPSFASLAAAAYTEAFGIDVFATTQEDFVRFVTRPMLVGLVAGSITGLIFGWRLASKPAPVFGARQFLTTSVLSLLFLLVGVLLLEDYGNSFSMLTGWVTANPISKSISELLAGYNGGQWQMLWYAALYNFRLAPFLLLLGVASSTCANPNRDLLVAFVPIGYFARYILLITLDSPITTYWAMLPMLAWSLPLVPIAVIGVGIGRHVRSRRSPQISLLDIINLCGIAGVVCFATICDGNVLIAVSVSVMIAYVAWIAVRAARDHRIAGEP